MSRWPSWQAIREPLIVLTCLGLTVYEAVGAQTFHPELLVFFAGLMATPLASKKDQARNARRAKPDQSPNSESDDRSGQ